MRVKKYFFIMTMTILINFLSPAFSHASVYKGVFDGTTLNFKEFTAIPLRGEWELYSMKLIEPSQFAKGSVTESPIYIETPTDLSKVMIDGKPLSSNVYGTLRLKVHVQDLDQVYALKNNYLTSSYKVWVNGELLATAGKVGMTKENYIPAYQPLEVVFKSDEEVLEIVIQVSNFHHRRVRISNFYLGTAEGIRSMTNSGIMKDSILFGSLLLISIYHFILYLIRRKEKVFFYFSIISFIVAVRVCIVNERLIIRVIPDLSAEVMMKIGYLPDYILLPLFIFYIREIFQGDHLKRAARLSLYALPIFISMMLFTTVKFYDGALQYALWIILGHSAYVMYLLLTKVIYENKSGIYVMIFGGLCVFFTAINDTLREYDIINTPELLTTGVLIFILSQAFFLAWRYNDSFLRAVRLAKENETMYKEIQELNGSLEQKIKIRTKELTYANQKLERLVKVDPLTELPNRRYFDESLKREWRHSLQFKNPLSLLMIDIDFFKGYNDFYGHIQGDECLRMVANHLKRSIRNETGVVARYGGEEFVVLLPNTNKSEAHFIAETIRSAIEELNLPHERSEIAEFITISIGIHSSTITEDLTVNQFINQADRALYKAKETSRNCVCFF